MKIIGPDEEGPSIEEVGETDATPMDYARWARNGLRAQQRERGEL